ncbi:hypothetical protein [Methylocystis sp. JR02]|uniref:hypothetical protein n=1 Tax=Methylocystis sp. JR02 TaxID=3046284 RepID=UPI0024BB023D|nr:hypothetical protein [Methylocystis sp. JR02]MDJ0449097.1 hypothetical protein [Methylocystis sp. JR02]
MRATSFDRDPAETAYRGPLRARPEGVQAALGMGVVSSVILAGAALLIRLPAPAPEIADAAPVAIETPAKITAKAATAVDNPAAATLDIASPEFKHEKKIVAVGEKKDGTPRVDSLTIGQFVAGGTFLRIDVHPNLDPRATNADFYLDMKNHAAAAGLTAAKIAQRSMVPTRFGAFETADIRLSQTGGEGAEASERACLATRLVEPKASLEIAGIACGAAGKPMDRVALACALDKLSYSAGADNKALNDFFLNAELARGPGCPNVSRDDLTASIPPQKNAHTKPTTGKPSVVKPVVKAKKKTHVAAQPAAVVQQAGETEQ